MRLSTGEKIFNVVNITILSMVALTAIYPFIYVLASSLSAWQPVTAGAVFLWPLGEDFRLGVSLAAYERVFQRTDIWIGYANSIFYSVVGTAVNLAMTALAAYPLSKSRLRGRGIVTFMIAFTMWFAAGMIPFFLTLRGYGMLNTRTVLIFAFALAAFNIFILRTNFQNVPDSLEESAKIDGANDFTILTKLYLPLSLPALATIGLFYFVGRWNAFFWSMILLTDDALIPLPVILNHLLVQADWGGMDVDAPVRAETLIHSTIVVSILPIMMAFPVLQKYFTKGMMIGSVKG